MDEQLTVNSSLEGGATADLTAPHRKEFSELVKRHFVLFLAAMIRHEVSTHTADTAQNSLSLKGIAGWANLALGLSTNGLTPQEIVNQTTIQERLALWVGEYLGPAMTAAWFGATTRGDQVTHAPSLSLAMFGRRAMYPDDESLILLYFQAILRQKVIPSRAKETETEVPAQVVQDAMVTFVTVEHVLALFEQISMTLSKDEHLPACAIRYLQASNITITA